MFVRLFGGLVVAVAALTGASPTSAAVIERDWKVPGDGLLTYDTVNKREWLDLSQTLLSDQFPGSGANEIEIREARYQYVVGQTAPGGLFEGFTVATSADVVALAQSAGIDTSTHDYPTNSFSVLVLEQLLGITAEQPRISTESNKFSIGLVDEVAGSPISIRASAIFVDIPVSQAELQIGTGHTQFSDPPGVMLYRVVPEPSSSTLIFLGWTYISFRNRFSHH